MPWHDFWAGGFWLFPLMMMLIMLICVFVFARIFLGRDGHGPCFFDRERRRPESVDSPLEIAKRRYARGEITKAEFEDIKNSIA